MKLSWKRREKAWRKELLSYAKGKVLEISVGQGAKFNSYPFEASAMALNMDAKMIGRSKYNHTQADFIVSRAEELRFAPQSFDSIISIFSLCAYSDPVRVLNLFNTWCKPGGTILLMEHGESKYRLGRWIQRMWEPYHYKKTGCHLNMDIRGIIETSEPSVQKIETKMGGMVYLVWASPS